MGAILFFVIAVILRVIIWYAQCSREFWLVMYCKDLTLKALRDVLVFTAIYGGVFWW